MSEMLPVVVTHITKTCGACPAQWQGTTDDGLHIYARYRYGRLLVGVGSTLEEAVDLAMSGRLIEVRFGDTYDGTLEYDQLKEHTAGRIVWPEREDTKRRDLGDSK